MLSPNFILKDDFLSFEKDFLERFRSVRQVNAGEVILGCGEDRSQLCFYVLSGLFACVIRHESGGIKVSTLRGRGTIFPLYYRYPSTSMEQGLEVVALEQARLLQIPKDALLAYMMEKPECAVAMLDVYGKYTTFLLYDATSQLFDSIRSKVCSFLYLQTPPETPDAVLTMSQDEIGAATGVSRANVSRIINELKREHVLSADRRKLVIHARDHLLRYCSYLAGLDADR